MINLEQTSPSQRGTRKPEDFGEVTPLQVCTTVVEVSTQFTVCMSINRGSILWLCSEGNQRHAKLSITVIHIIRQTVLKDAFLCGLPERLTNSWTLFYSLTWHSHYRQSPHFLQVHFRIKRDRGLAPSYRSQSLGCPAETGVLKSSYVPTDTHCSCTIQHYVITSSLAGPPSNLCCLSDFVVTLLFFLLQFLWFLGHIQWYALKQLQ